VAELDPDLVPVAERWFGFRPDKQYLQPVLGDGAALLRRIRAELDATSPDRRPNPTKTESQSQDSDPHHV
jgi:hypothetical protein